MGRRYENWLSKAGSPKTQLDWRKRWSIFVRWVVSAENPLTGKPYMECGVDHVDEVIRRDFETMPSHLFQDKYANMLTKFITSFKNAKANTIGSYLGSVRSFFTNEAMSIRLPRDKVPAAEMAENEHVFVQDELRQMWLVADVEGKARLSVAVSLGWSVGDFLALSRDFMANVLEHVDKDGFVAFDYQRKKTRARVRGILNPCAVRDIQALLPQVPPHQDVVWNATTTEGLNKWVKTLVHEAGIRPSGTMRFHLFRKYTYDLVTSKCGAYEAKLLVGKTIPLKNMTYLHGLQDRLLDRYKKFAYPFLKLNGEGKAKAEKFEALDEKLEKQRIALEVIQDNNQQLRQDVEGLRTENQRLRQNTVSAEDFEALKTENRGLKDNMQTLALTLEDLRGGFEELARRERVRRRTDSSSPEGSK